MAKDTTTKAKEDIRVAAENALRLVNQAAGENAKLLASAILDASKLLASQAESARQTVATQASEALKVSSATTSGDHDLLQRVDQKVDGLIITVEKMSSRDNLFVLKEDFNVWRNILISGMLLTIVVGIISRFLSN